MTTSKPLYVYLQRPDTAEWVTVGRYLLDNNQKTGEFLYAPSYIRAGLSWSIDPVNLPFIPDKSIRANRYNGLHDVLRDACPDAWGRMLIARTHGLPTNTHDVRYLTLAGNADRWGGLAVGANPKPSVAKLASPRLAQLEILSAELLAMYERRPPVDASLRNRLMATPSLGGARPKATVKDGDRFWLVKPYLPTDTVNVPLLEHCTQQWGRECGLNFALTVLHHVGDGLNVVRVLRFDRHAERRMMAVSGASLLQTEYPGAGLAHTSSWSYPRLAEELKLIGAPKQDQQELFGRMVFNAVVGNDDDHPRNHAVIFDASENRWRLSPAFDVVPNPLETPRHLTMQLSLGRTDISRQSIVADAMRFGFDSPEHANDYLNHLLIRIGQGFTQIDAWRSDRQLYDMMSKRLREQLQLLQ